MEVMEQLQAPFKPDEVEWRVGVTSNDKTKGLALAYVTNRAIQNRLDEVFGVFGWKNEFHEWKKDGQLCGISVKFEGEWITKFDGADDSNMEATKGGLSDAMKRAAYQWGIGRYLYELPSVWMPIKKQGSSYVLTDTPKLPAWALPEGYKPEKQSSTVEEAEKVFTQKASEEQRQALGDIAKTFNLSPVDMIGKMDKLYNVKSSKDLTAEQASELLAIIQAEHIN
jgi:hypothetical protein